MGLNSVFKGKFLTVHQTSYCNMLPFKTFNELSSELTVKDIKYLYWNLREGSFRTNH